MLIKSHQSLLNSPLSVNGRPPQETRTIGKFQRVCISSSGKLHWDPDDLSIVYQGLGPSGNARFVSRSFSSRGNLIIIIWKVMGPSCTAAPKAFVELLIFSQPLQSHCLFSLSNPMWFVTITLFGDEEAEALAYTPVIKSHQMTNGQITSQRLSGTTF